MTKQPNAKDFKMLNTLKKFVENHYQINDISAYNRTDKYVEARAIFSIIARQNTYLTLKEIGKYINRGHDTVSHHNKKKYNSWLSTPKYNFQKLQNIQIIYNNFRAQYKNEFILFEMKKNPYEAYLGKEDILQASVMDYIKLKYPSVLAIHVPNEGKRTTFERYKFKYLGGKAGVPDILIFSQNKYKCGLAIELKAGYNKPTENQIDCLERLRKANWTALWSNNFDDTVLSIDNYFNNVKNEL